MKKLPVIALVFLLLLSLCACGSKEKPCEHDWVLQTDFHPTCTASGYQDFTCSICGETYHLKTADALGHTPKNTNYTKISNPTCTKNGSRSNVCSVCGAEYTETVPSLGHNYVDGKCTRCGERKDSGVRLDDAEAFTVAEAMVKQKLKAPSTAKFCLYTEATITHDKDVYTVKGWVDAQNSFGATLRSNWTVTFTAVKSGGKIGGEHGTVTID